jgi:hypothetical protein
MAEAKHDHITIVAGPTPTASGKAKGIPLDRTLTRDRSDAGSMYEEAGFDKPREGDFRRKQVHIVPTRQYQSFLILLVGIFGMASDHVEFSLPRSQQLLIQRLLDSPTSRPALFMVILEPVHSMCSHPPS